jgi:DNA polymerase-3 subunit gamma/tau
VVTALYRRYRPETFAELIGQSQVTDPLRTALRTDRVNHAYLFSGPRGCGKTTSARILARCLNCVEGPTDTPCGVCPSCVELSREGGGSMDVVEIDAASHGGVDDARDLRERAIFAPARDRYKIFILDEAHMVTTTGFNALLKIVEEPPEHVKFIFATTEPEKVIGTIRSRTHHYPFRLVPPAQMLEYVQHLCEEESITVAPGVLPLVVRAGGGSVRDTLSLLDQLMAGSEGANIEYERAVALLGYTHGALLDEVVDSVGARDAAAAFAAIDRIIQTGQDPRRFVEDLLERLRDLIIVAATGDGASAVLRGIPQDELERMAQQSHKFGSSELSRAADVVNAALTEMTGATSPRLHLELMIARILVPASDESERGSLARLERLERRIGIDGAEGAGAPAGSPDALGGGSRPAIAEGSPRASAGGSAYPERAVRPPLNPPRTEQASTLGRRREPVRPQVAQAPAAPVTPAVPAAATSSWPVTAVPGSLGAPKAEPVETPAVESVPVSSAEPAAPASGAAATGATPESSSTESSRTESSATDSAAGESAAADPASETAPSAEAPEAPASRQGAPTSPTVAMPASTAAAPAPAAAAPPVTLQQMRDSWPEILELVKRDKRSAWIVVFSSQARALAGDVLTLTFPNDNDVADFRQPPVDGEGVSEYLRRAILDVLGIRVKFIARVEPTMASTAASARAAAASPQSSAAPQAQPNAAQPTGGQVRPLQTGAPRTSTPQAGTPPTRAPQSAPAQSAPARTAPAQSRPPQGAAPRTSEPARAQQGQQTRPPQGRGPQQPGSAPAAQAQGRTQQPARKLSDLPDSAAPPPDDYVEPIEPDLQSEYEPGGWAVAPIPGGATPTPKQNEQAEAAKAATKPALVIDPTAPPVRPFGKGTPPPVLAPGEKQRYGESVVREILGASFIEEEPVAPRVIPMPRND